jgi:NAD(P)-dependent dehydrogenase (short-subunit alcohol dehydrogenase family)
MPETALDNSRGLSGKVIVITGRSGDIGAETNARLSSFGARVIPFDLRSEDDGAARAPQLGAVAYKKVDQGHADELQRVIEQVVRNSIGSIS